MQATPAFFLHGLNEGPAFRSVTGRERAAGTLRLFRATPFMAVAPSAQLPAVFDLKSASLTLVSLVLRSTDLDALASELQRRFGDAPKLFDRDPVVIDLAAVANGPAIDFTRLAALLREHKLLPLAVRGGSAAQIDAARAAGLAEAPLDVAPPAARASAAAPAASQGPALAPARATAPTLLIDKPLRSGQQVYARGGDLVVLAAVNFGAEVIADGSIHVYAPLRGRAIAGAKGDVQARIFSTCMEPQLVSIAGTYRTTDTALPADVLGRPAQVRLAGDTLLVEPLKL
jgi:septum site-determining protein MinC